MATAQESYVEGEGGASTNSGEAGTSWQQGQEAEMLRGPDSAEPSRRFAWFNKYNAQRLGKALLALLIFLTTLALIGSGLYVSILAFPAIAAALTSAYALTSMPQIAIPLIAALPAIVMSAVLLRFIQIHLRPYYAPQDPGVAVGGLEYTVRHNAAYPFQYAKRMFVAAFWMKLLSATEQDATMVEHDAARLEHQAAQFAHAAGTRQTPRSARRWAAYNSAAFLTALGLGIFLTVQIVPTLLAAVITLGVPFPVAVLFGAVAAATLIVITYQLLALALTLRDLAQLFHHLKKHEEKGYNPYAYLAALGAVVGLGVGIALSTVFFPMLVNTLAPMLTSSMAGFTAVAVSVSLALLMIRLVPLVIVAPPMYIHAKWSARKAKGMESVDDELGRGHQHHQHHHQRRSSHDLLSERAPYAPHSHAQDATASMYGAQAGSPSFPPSYSGGSGEQLA